MTDAEPAPDAEFAAMQSIHATLVPLEDDVRIRVLTYVMDRLKISITGQVKPQPTGRGSVAEREAETPDVAKLERNYQSFAELHDATQPKTRSEKALIAGYWIQAYGNADGFEAQAANKELKHVGERVENITGAFEILKNQKPALVIQLKKSGKTKQARKVYKITAAGMKEVERMIGG